MKLVCITFIIFQKKKNLRLKKELLEYWYRASHLYWYRGPPLLVQRCNGTSAGQVYLEVCRLEFPCKISPSGSEPVTVLICCKIIVPSLCWQTFGYCDRASDVQGTCIGSSRGYSSTDFDLKNTSQLTTHHVQACFNLSSSRFQSTSSMQP